jgi:zinc-finger of transposase IS204/IS1001/IS1096/IS1165
MGLVSPSPQAVRNQARFESLHGVRVLNVERDSEGWSITASGPGDGLCPTCGRRWRSRHSAGLRQLRDLPLKGTPVVIRLRVARLRCREVDCDQQIFAEAATGAGRAPLRRTCRVIDKRLNALGHAPAANPLSVFCRGSALRRATTTFCTISNAAFALGRCKMHRAASASMTGRGPRDRPTEPSWWRSSAETGTGSMQKERVSAHLKPSRLSTPVQFSLDSPK